MLPADSAIAAQLMALAIRSANLRHFHDPQQQAARAFAGSLGAAGKVAWDIYLFYPPGRLWQNCPPPPAVWAHQLGKGSWADPLCYRHGDGLVTELRRGLDWRPGRLEP
jgi:hypothetical protein